MATELSNETKDRIQREAKEKYPIPPKHDFKGVLSQAYDNIKHQTELERAAYISGAEAERLGELVEALKKIDTISFQKDYWKEMADIGQIAKQAIDNYKK